MGHFELEMKRSETGRLPGAADENKNCEGKVPQSPFSRIGNKFAGFWNRGVFGGA